MIVVAAVGCLVLGTWQRDLAPGAVLLSRDGLYWTGSQTAGMGYYADLVHNPTETPQQFLEKEAAAEAAATEESATTATPMTGLAALHRRQGLYDTSKIAVGWPKRYMEDLKENPGESAEEFLEKEADAAAPPSIPASSFATAPRVQGLRQMSEDDDWDGPKQMFHVPDLEQETDGLDMMQDYAPAHVQIKRSATHKKAIAQAAHASRKSDETYEMHSLRNAHVAKPFASPQSLYEQPLKTAVLGVRARNTVEPTAESINTYLQDVSLRAQEHTGTVDARKLAQLRGIVHSLQDLANRDPQWRIVIAKRLSLLKSEVAQSQKLQDYDSVYLAPYVDDLDNYLQGVLTEVNRVEIPSLDDEDKAVMGTQTLKSVEGTEDPRTSKDPDTSSPDDTSTSQDDGDQLQTHWDGSPDLGDKYDHLKALHLARGSMLRARDSQYNPEAVPLDVEHNAFWGNGGHNVVQPAAYHFHAPLSMSQMADADYVPDGFATGGPSHSNVASGNLNEYRAPVGSSMLHGVGSSMLRALPAVNAYRALPAFNAYRARVQNLAGPAAAKTAAGQVTYTAETTATPWGKVVGAPQNDFIDEVPVSRGFRAVGSRGLFSHQQQLMNKYAQPIPSVTGFGYTDVPGRDGYEFSAVAAGPSDTHNYWLGAHSGDEKGPKGVHVGGRLLDVFDSLNPVIGE